MAIGVEDHIYEENLLPRIISYHHPYRALIWTDVELRVPKKFIINARRAKKNQKHFRNLPGRISEAPKTTEAGIGELKLVFASVSSLAHNLFNAGESTQTRNGDVPSAMSNNENTKTLSNVKVYPVPILVSEQLNISCHLSKDTDITIKLMDILSNEIAILSPTSRVSAGDWTNSFSLPSRLESGMPYFIQIIAGREVTVTRILVK